MVCLKDLVTKSRRHYRKSILLFCLFPFSIHAQQVSTLAGQTGISGSANGTGTAASFDGPHGVACDQNGNTYVADKNNNKIRKITAAGVVSTFAGSGIAGSNDGTGAAASFYEPWGIACDTAGNVYVADTKNYKIRKITPAGVVTTIAGTGVAGTTNGLVSVATFSYPTGIAIADNGTIYVAEFMTHTIREISNGNVGTLAGSSYLTGSTDGTGTAARFNHPHHIAFDPYGNLIVSDTYNNKIRKITPAGVVTTIAGSGTQGYANGNGTAAQFNYPYGIAVDDLGNIFVGDLNNFVIRKITSSGTVTTYAGTPGVSGSANGLASVASFNSLSALSFSSIDHSITAGDEGNNLIRKIIALSSVTITLSSTASSFCLGENVVITASPNNMTNYVFREGNTILGTSNNGILSINTLGVGVHNITCTALDAQSALASTTTALQITIINQSAATISPAGPITLCSGQSVVLTASQGNSYQWSNGATTQSITVNINGNYIVTVSTGNSCNNVSTPVQVSVLSPLSVSISPANPQPVCQGDSILLTASTASTYLWSNGKTTQSIFAKTAGAYTVTATNSVGCSATSNSVTVSITPVNFSAVITPGGPVTIINGNSTTLSLNSGTNYIWSNGATAQAISVNTHGLFWGKVLSSSGCYSLADSVIVDALGVDSIISTTGSTSICQGDSVKLSSSYTSGNQWFKDNTVITGAVNQNYWATVAGYYKVRVNFPDGSFVVSDSILVTLKSMPSTVQVTGATVCTGSTASISAVAQPNVFYKWYDQPSGGTSLGAGNTFVTPPIAGNTTYYVQINGTNGCVSQNLFPVNVTVLAHLSISFSYSYPITVATGFLVYFENTTGPGYSYEWYFGDNASGSNNSLLENPSHTYPALGDYTVQLIADGSTGCKDTLTKLIHLTQELDLFIPTTFTPNGDGHNDIFKVRGPNIKNVTMQIFNQWGQLIYESDNAKEGWDGSVKGRTVQNSTYSYVIKVFTQDGLPHPFQGQISVIK